MVEELTDVGLLDEVAGNAAGQEEDAHGNPAKDDDR